MLTSQRPADPRQRASDHDRDTVARLLGEHAALGRLTPEELDERTDAVFTARTWGELQALTADLPPEPERAGPRQERRRLSCCCRW